MIIIGSESFIKNQLSFDINPKLFSFMGIRNLLTGLFVCLSILMVDAQDLHFTNFRLAPLTINPALAGAFEGTIRVGGIYRGQWLDVSGYKTPALYVDSPVIRGFRKNDWVGVGISFFSDKAGIGGLTDTGGSLNAAYHLGLDKNNIRNNIAIGVSWGNISRKLTDANNFTLRDELVGGPGTLSPDKMDLLSRMDGESYTDWTAGVTLHYDLTKRNRLKAGLAAGHITTPINSLINTRSEDGFKITGFAQLELGMTDRFSIEPAVLFQIESPGKELALQGLAGYVLDPKKDLELNAGLGYRVGDAVQLLLGATYGDLNVGASFDANASSFQGASGFQNGFEIGASYIIKIYKKPNVKPVIICPRF